MKEIWRFVKTQDISFWLINLFLFFEYVRPQTIYPVIDIIPYAQVTIILTTLSLFITGNSFSVNNILNKLLLIYLIIIIFSSIYAISPDVSFNRIIEFFAWVLIYYLIINIVNTEKRFLVFILAFFLYNFKMSQYSFFNWAQIGFTFASSGTGGGPGWFENSGEFGIEMCIFFPLSIYFIVSLKQYWSKIKLLFFLLFPFSALTGMISSSSRGAILGGVATLFLILMKSKHRIKGMFILILLGLVLIKMIPSEQIARINNAGSVEDRTSQTRVERWKKGLEMGNMHPFLGVGFKNWAVADRKYFGGTGSDCHNIFIECVSELGYSGLTVFCLMILGTFINNHRTRKIVQAPLNDNKFIYYFAHGLDVALIGYLVSGFFVTVLYYPFFWINMAMTVALNNVAKQKIVR